MGSTIPRFLLKSTTPALSIFGRCDCWSAVYTRLRSVPVISAVSIPFSQAAICSAMSPIAIESSASRFNRWDREPPLIDNTSNSSSSDTSVVGSVPPLHNLLYRRHFCQTHMNTPT